MIGISFKACESTAFIKCMKMKVGCPLRKNYLNVRPPKVNECILRVHV